MTVKNQDRERAVATPGLTPIRPNNKTKAPSLTPIPEIEIGIIVKMEMMGK